VGGGCIQERPTIRGCGFIDFSERDRADQHAIAFNEHEIRGHHKIRTPEHLSDAAASRFP
jgi:hypothetical protein